MRSRNRRRPSAPSIQSRSCAGTSQTMRMSRARAVCGAVLPSMRVARGGVRFGGKLDLMAQTGPGQRGADLPADRLGAAYDLLGGGAAQATPGRQEGHGLHQVGLARAVRAEKRHGAAVEVEPRALVTAEMRKTEIGDMGGHGLVFTQENVWEKPAFLGRNCRQFRPVTRASASRRRSRSGRRLPASGLVRPRRRT